LARERNARVIEERGESRVIRTIALLALVAAPVLALDISLKGTWKPTLEQTWHCDEPASLAAEQFSFEIQQAPLLNSAFSSFNYTSADVIGYLALRVHLEHSYPAVAYSYPDTLISGLLVGEIVRNTAIGSGAKAKPVAFALKGYVLSREQYAAWIQSRKLAAPPQDAGEAELEVSGNPFQGYTLTGIVRSGEACEPVSPSSGMGTDLTGHFGRGVTSKWSAHVTLSKQ
jgi:hypothetical protein